MWFYYFHSLGMILFEEKEKLVQDIILLGEERAALWGNGGGRLKTVITLVKLCVFLYTFLKSIGLC